MKTFFARVGCKFFAERVIFYIETYRKKCGKKRRMRKAYEKNRYAYQRRRLSGVECGYERRSKNSVEQRGGNGDLWISGWL
jgi:hypothetical protein